MNEQEPKHAGAKRPRSAIKIVVIVLALLALGVWYSTPRTQETELLPDVQGMVPEPPRFGETASWRAMRAGEAPAADATELERQLLEAYRRFNYVPPTSSLLFDAPSDFRSDKSGLAEVRRVIQPGSEQEFLGVLSAEEFLYPGRIISITPIARPDYRLPPKTLAGLLLHPHEVYAAAVTSARREPPAVQGDADTLPSGTDQVDGTGKRHYFNSSTIPEGKQDETGIHYQKFLQELNSQGAHTANGHTVFIYKTANTLEEGYQQLGINASYGAASIVASTREEHRSDQQHVFIMLKQEFFRVHSDSTVQSPQVLIARVQATSENVSLMHELAEWNRTETSKIPYQHVPAVIKSVTYGRIIILASEDARFSKSEIDALTAKYSSPTVNLQVEFEQALKTLLQRSTLKIVTWGGGPMEFRDNDGNQVSSQEGKVSLISHDYAAKILSGAAGSNVAWDPQHPGRAIGFTAYYLDQAGTQAHSFSLSDKNLLVSQSGYPTDAHLSFYCGDDQDGFLAGSGEWEFKIKTTGDPTEHSFKKWTDIDDGDPQPQMHHVHRMIDLSYAQPLTLDISGKEQDESNWVHFPISFKEADLKPVPDAFVQFSDGALHGLTTTVSKLSNEFGELRKLGDLHKVTVDDAVKVGGAYKIAWDEAQVKVAELRTQLELVRRQQVTVKSEWPSVKKALGSHQLTGESPVSRSSKFKVVLTPHSSATIATVEGLLTSLARTLDRIEEGLK